MSSDYLRLEITGSRILAIDMIHHANKAENVSVCVNDTLFGTIS